MSISSLIGCFYQRPPPPTYLSTKKLLTTIWEGIQTAHNSSFQKKCLHAILLLTETPTKQWKRTRSLCVGHPWHSESIPHASKSYEESHSKDYRMWSKEDRIESSYKWFCPCSSCHSHSSSHCPWMRLAIWNKAGTQEGQRVDGKTWPTLYQGLFHWERREISAGGSKVHHLEKNVNIYFKLPYEKVRLKIFWKTR